MFAWRALQWCAAHYILETALGNSRATQYVVLVTAPLQTWYFALALANGSDDLFFTTSPHHVRACNECLAVLVYEVFLYVRHGKKWIFWLHHLIATTFCTLALTTTIGQHVIAWAGICECTGLFLAVHLLNVERLKLVNGILLWITFLTFRILNLGVLTARVAWEVSGGGPHHPFWVRLLPCVCLVGWMMNVHWFSILHARVMAHLQ